MTAATDNRVPLWRMTDEQLRFYVADDTISWDRRKTAEMILLNREQQRNNTAAAVSSRSQREA